MEKTTYYLIGPSPGTNLLKKVGPVMYWLNHDNEWEPNGEVLRHLHEPDTEVLTEDQAKQAWARITNGKAWAP